MFQLVVINKILLKYFFKILISFLDFFKTPEREFSFAEIKKRDTYNWLTETSLDTFAMQDFSADSGYGSYTNSLSKSHLIANKGDMKLSGKGGPNTTQQAKSEEKSNSHKHYYYFLYFYLRQLKVVIRHHIGSLF